MREPLVERYVDPAGVREARIREDQEVRRLAVLGRIEELNQPANDLRRPGRVVQRGIQHQ